MFTNELVDHAYWLDAVQLILPHQNVPHEHCSMNLVMLC